MSVDIHLLRKGDFIGNRRYGSEDKIYPVTVTDAVYMPDEQGRLTQYIHPREFVSLADFSEMEMSAIKEGTDYFVYSDSIDFDKEHDDLSEIYSSCFIITKVKEGGVDKLKVLSTPDPNFSQFLVDGMVDSVEISDGALVITWNTSAGKEPVSIQLSDIFDPENYYTKNGVESYVSGVLPSVGNGKVSITVNNPTGAKTSGVYNGLVGDFNLNDNTDKVVDITIPAQPTVPTNVSDLNNDSGFQTASDVSSAISTATQNFQTASDVASAIGTATQNFQTASDVATAIGTATQGMQTASDVSSAIATATQDFRTEQQIITLISQYAPQPSSQEDSYVVTAVAESDGDYISVFVNSDGTSPVVTMENEELIIG